MQSSPIVLRKLTLLTTILVLPGGLMALCAIAVALMLMRSDGGRRMLVGLKRRLPERLKAPLRRALLVASGEQLFLARPTRLP
jgi:hypothetical protein